MKKILLACLAILMCLSVIACDSGAAGGETEAQSTSGEPTDQGTEPQSTDAATEPEDDYNRVLKDDVTTLLTRMYQYDGFKPKTRSIIDTNLQSFAIDADNQIFYTSIKDLSFSEGIASDPLMQPCPFMVCMFRLNDMTQLDSVTAQLAEKADPNRWSCASLTEEQIRVANIGDVVVLIMAEEAGDVLDAFYSLAPSEY